FAFRGMAPGRYDIHTSHPLYQLDAESMMENLGIGEDDVSDLTAHALAIVRGRVIDEEKKPLAGVAISRVDSQAPPRISASEGTFTMRVPAAPAMKLLASRSGYAAQATQVAAVAGEAKDVVITMRRGVALTLHIIDGDSKAITDAVVTFSDPSQVTTRSQGEVPACGGKACNTSSEGNVNARVLPGTYDIHVTGPTIVAKHLGAIAIDDRSAPMTITVARGLEVSGRAVFSDGQPAAGAMILMRIDGTLTFVGGNEDGTFSIHNAPARPLSLHAELPQVRIPGEEKEVTPPATGVELKVRRGGSVAGRVIDATSHEPVTDFNIYVLRNRMASQRAMPFQSDDGSFLIDNVAPGTVELQVVSLGHARASATGIEVEESKTASGVELKMERAARVKGRITTADGQPVTGATAYVKESRDSMTMTVDRVISDANGGYEIGSVPPGDRTIVFGKQGFMRQEKNVDAAGGKELRVDVILERGHAIAGRVINERGEPLGDSELVSENATNFQRTRSDAEGGFRIDGLADGMVRIRAGKEGYATATAEVDSASTQPLTLTLRRGASVSGRVSGLTAEQLPSVRIFATSEGSTPITSGVSANGTFTLNGVADGSLTVHATYALRTVQKVVEVVNGAAPPIELTFVDGFTIHGVVTVHRQPLPGAFVRFDPVGDHGSSAVARTAGDGSYQVTGVAAGDYDVVVSASDYATLAQERRTISGTAVQNIDVKASSVRGRVVDARTLAPIAEARVAVESAADTVTWQHNVVTSDSDGRFAFEFLRSGTYTLTAQRESYTTSRKPFVLADSAVELDVQLTAGNAMTIRVVDAASGRPVAADFALIDSAGSIVFSGEARAEDGVGRAWVAPGTYTLRVMSGEYAPDVRSINVPGAEIRVALVSAGRIVVTTRTPHGPVRVTGGSGEQMSVDGRFDGLLPGDYVVELLGGGDKPVAKKTATVRAGETTTVTFD
ncbi:MAG TPA: carboxypeptidase regulatory-like domain-containing protein, partial [Thermoanaerobaculia bacterium]|nr:carboxypeptidase regulatory-like domain-containing protein [Thermoanaerobaculia bacterium]